MDVFDELDSAPATDVFDELAPDKKDVFDELEEAAPVVRSAEPGSLEAHHLVPAVRKIGGELAIGEPGDTHPDIIERDKIPATDIDQRGFFGPFGFMDRESAAQALLAPTNFEPGRLHSTDLNAAQDEGFFKLPEQKYDLSSASLPRPTDEDFARKMQQEFTRATLARDPAQIAKLAQEEWYQQRGLTPPKTPEQVLEQKVQKAMMTKEEMEALGLPGWMAPIERGVAQTAGGLAQPENVAWVAAGGIPEVGGIIGGAFLGQLATEGTGEFLGGAIDIFKGKTEEGLQRMASGATQLGVVAAPYALRGKPAKPEIVGPPATGEFLKMPKGAEPVKVADEAITKALDSAWEAGAHGNEMPTRAGLEKKAGRAFSDEEWSAIQKNHTSGQEYGLNEIGVMSPAQSISHATKEYSDFLNKVEGGSDAFASILEKQQRGEQLTPQEQALVSHAANWINNRAREIQNFQRERAGISRIEAEPPPIPTKPVPPKPVPRMPELPTKPVPPKPVEAKPAPAKSVIEDFTAALEEPGFQRAKRMKYEAGMSVKSLGDLESLAELKDNYSVAEKGPMTPEKAMRGANRAVQAQLPREAVEVALSFGSQDEATAVKKLGGRPLDWRKNPEAAKWIVENAERMGWENNPSLPEVKEFVAGLEKPAQKSIRAGPTETFDYSPEDLSKYQELKSNLAAFPKTLEAIQSPEYTATMREYENLRNKYNGNPPKQLVGKPPAPAAPKPLSLEEQAQASMKKSEDAYFRRMAQKGRKPQSTLSQVVEREGRQTVSELLDEWQQGAELSEDGKSITSFTDPRNRTGRKKTTARDFLLWLEDRQAAPKPVEPALAPATAPQVETRLSPSDKGISKEEKAFRATAEGQKAMASRASRIGTLQMMNEAIRKIDPNEAYPRNLIETLPDSQIDSWMEDLRQTWNKVKAAQTATGAQPELVGLGAAEKGETAPGAQIEQLTQALQNVRESRAPLGQQIREAFAIGDRLSSAKDAIGRAVSGLKATGDLLIKKWQGVPNIDDLLRAKKTLSKAIESRGWRLQQWEKAAYRAVPNPRDQAAIAKWVDAGGDTATLQRGLAEAPAKYKRAYQDALNLSGDKLTAAQNVQNYFESRLQEAIDAGVLDHGVENYLHRIYENKPALLKRALAYTQTGLLNKNPALAKKRFFQFDWEAEKAGFTPVQSFIKRITDYEASLSKAIAAREFIKSASEMKAADGRPIVDIKGVGIPVEDAAGVREGTLIKPKFNPAKNNDPTLPNGDPNPNYRGDYVNRDYRALSRWKWAGTDAGGKPIFVQGDVAIHPDYVGRVDALLKPSQVRFGKFGAVLRPALGVSSTIKQTMLDLSGFHPVQITVHGLEHRVLPWKIIQDIDLSHPDVDGLLQGGVTLGGDYSGIHREGLVGASLTRKVPWLGPVMESYHQWLFQSYIPRIKMTMALHALERNRARYAGRLTDEQIFHKTASEANSAFGELNYTVLERSKTAQDMARLILLAPDFLEARGRFAAQAFTRGGKMFGNEQRTALLLGALTMWVTARIANKMVDDQYHFEPENMFNIVKDGHAYGLRTVQGDILHMLTKPMQFMMSRLNPVYARTLLEALTGRDYFGRRRSPAEQVWDAASTTIPISLRSNRERTIWESLANAFGVTARRYSDVDDAFKLAQKWKDTHAVPERGEFIYDPNKDVLRPLKLALNHGDEAAAAVEIKKLIDSKVYNIKKLDEYFKRFASMPFTGSKANDKKFITSLTEDQRKTVEAARQHKNEIRKLYMKSRSQYLAPASTL